MIVATVVLNWNRREDTLACLSDLALQTVRGVDQRLLLVDNGSGDGTVEAVREAHPAVSVLALKQNLGYAPAVNAGIRRALDWAADWTWLVNNDTRPRPGLLERLVAAMGPPDVGLAAPTVRYMDDPERIWPSAGRRRSWTLAAFDTTASPPSRTPYDVDWATGCCLLVRAAVWRDVGLLDERFAFYYEDHDLCLRARAVGWRIVHVPDAEILHRVAASTGQGSPRQQYLLARASVPYYVRHTRGAHRAFIAIYRAASFVRTAVRWLARGRPRAALAYARGLRDGVADVRRAAGPRAPWDPFAGSPPG